jgi:hypothetical protein
MKTLGVITGDIVNSREMSAEDRSELYKVFRKFLTEIRREKRIQDFEVFRGDSFQCSVRNSEEVLSVAVMIRAFIKSYISGTQKEIYEDYKGKGRMAIKGYFPGKQDIKLAIGIGGVDFIKKQSFLQSDGQAFRFSGESLDSMKSTSYRMNLTTMDSYVNYMMEPSILLLDSVIQKWTNNQAETVLLKLKDISEEEIAYRLKITRSAVSQRMRTSQWYAIEKLLRFFTETMKKI